ncbi:hypothetical protein C8R44DRAFT_760539 [Mycena epipterygia]|nr:hypothetical protein C8R44DRAFT_760539 [Mycena epipterygia]
MLELAQELIDTIVDQLAQTDAWYSHKDLNSLRACSLVARRFLAPSQRHLFRWLTLNPQTIQNGSSGFNKSPRLTPLASYVRDLHIEGPFASYHLDPLASFLPLLSTVERLVIKDFINDWNTCNWSANFPTAFAGLLSLPSLRCFALVDHAGAPASLLRRALASYHEVAFIRVQFSEENQFRSFADEPSRPRPPILGHLVLQQRWREDSSLRNLMLDKEIEISLAKLQYLELRLSMGGLLDGLEELALKCSGSIRHLTIDFGKQHDNGIRLPNMPNLSFLTLKATVNRFRVPYSVLSVAGSLPICMPRIEVLDFVIQADYKAYSDDMHRPDVDNALRDLQHLWEVRFTAACEARDIPFERDIRKKLPMASDAGLLSFCSMTSGARYHPMRHFSN